MLTRLNRQFGLHPARSPIDHADCMLDWEFMPRASAAARPALESGGRLGPLDAARPSLRHVRSSFLRHCLRSCTALLLPLFMAAACDGDKVEGTPSSLPLDGSSQAAVDAPMLDAIPDVLIDDATIDGSADGEAGVVFTSILDDFDRPDGALNSAGVTGWIDDGNHGLMQYGVARGELATTATTAMPIWWNAYYGGSVAAAEAFITVRNLSPDATDFSLLLMSQTLSSCDFIQVRYDPATGTLVVSSCQLGASTVYGTPAEVGAIDNRRIGARFETPTAKLSVYVDTTQVGSFIIDQWRYLGRPGRIGLWVRRGGTGAEMDTFDDFGGG
jgi:hypothetical protein